MTQCMKTSEPSIPIMLSVVGEAVKRNTSVRALGNRPDTPQNIIKGNLKLLEEILHKAEPYNDKQNTRNNLVFTVGSQPANERSIQLALRTIS